MDAVLNWLWQGCVVALALFAMLRLLERARANVRYLVCWAALLLVVALPALPWLGSLGLRRDALGLAPVGAIASVPDAWWTSGTVMVAAWMVWASVHTVRFMWAMVALRRARVRSKAFPTRVESLLSHWRHVRDEGRRPSLVLSEAVTTAAVLGCGAPVIAVAPSLVTTLDADELDRVLIHEWAHVQRRDDVVNVLQVFVRVLVGWHPAAWWIDRRLHIEREIACDEMTIEVTGSAKSYAACLVKIAGLKRSGERTALAPAVLTASGLRARVTRIVSRHVFIAPIWSRSIATAVVSVLCLVSIAVGGLTLVEATALALPFDSLRAIGTGLEGGASVAMPTFASHVETAPLPRQSVTSTPSDRRPIAEEPPVAPAPSDAVEQLISVPAIAVDSTGLHATADGGADSGAVPEPAAVAATVPAEQPPAAAEDSRSVWSAAADGGAAIGRKSADGGAAIGRKSAEGGTAIGRKSKEAGVATAGFFTRFARGVADSF
jgi:beta-lactamase regulating signal transducer with metallopeptidase domain